MGLSKKPTASKPTIPLSPKAQIQQLQAQLEECRKNELLLIEQTHLIRRFFEITASPSKSMSEKIQFMLQLGCERFKLPIGILAHIKGEQYEVAEVCSPKNMIRQGSIFPLGQTYCRNTLQAKEPIGFEHASHSAKWNTHPAFEAFKIEAYLGTRVTLNGRTFGTLNFSSLDPYEGKLSKIDKEFIQLMAKWVSEVIATKAEEDRMRQVHTLLESIVENLPDMIFVKDAKDLRFVRFNKAGEALLGHPRESLLGKTDYDFFPTEEADFFTTKDREVLNNKTLVEIPEEQILHH